MFTTLTPNPCIDKTLSVPKFDVYKMNRVRVLRNDFGGKGINVSTALRNLGAETCALGFSFAEDDTALKESLHREGIPCDFITLPGKMRTCYKLFDESLRHTIEINEYGTAVKADAGEKLLELLKKHAAKSSFVTLSGSLPTGIESDFYFHCIQAIRSVAPKCRIVVDAEKKLLLKALEAAPSILKPNIHEFQETFGLSIHSINALDIEARKVVRQYGIEILCISLGADGAYITDGNEAWKCSAAQVTVRSIQGAGDSLIAGLCMAAGKGKSLPEILHYGIAAAGDSISKEGTRLCTREGVEELLKQDVAMTRIGN